ncbi:MAG: hypothetical protein H7A21_02260 [Spirochaetales bacterium]|nr:hypothetical protein [Leptospiraceae bacterium]MCP5480231.1 hypothetical protein [Spirochaetales bacterium]
MLTHAQTRVFIRRSVFLRPARLAAGVCGLLLFLFGGCRSSAPGGTLPAGSATIDSPAEARSAGLPVFVGNLELRPPNAVGGVDLDLDVQNVSNRTIKLVLFVFRAYNRSGQPAPCNIRRSAEYTVRVEDLPAGEHFVLSSQGAYYSRQVACVTPIDAIQIIYDDNSTERIEQPEQAFAPGLTCQFQPST